MESNLLVVGIAVAIIAWFVFSFFNDKEAKIVKKSISTYMKHSFDELHTSKRRSNVSADLDWADDILETFGMDVEKAITKSHNIRAQLNEPQSATKASGGAK